jgi:hypothetical protein
MYKSIFFVITFFIFTIKAQTFEWAKKMGGESGEFPRGIDIDLDGNVYTCGFFLGIADFDPNASEYELTSNGETDVFINKIDESGNLIWANKIGGIRNETSYSIVVDNDANSYIVGSFQDTVDFNSGNDIENLISLNQSIFLTKIDGNGNFIWAKSLNGNLNSIGDVFSVTLDNDNNIYCTGYFKDSIDFDPSTSEYFLNGGNAGDVFVLKLNSNGNFIWAKKMGGAATDKGNEIQCDENGNVCITGIFQGQADFNPNSEINNLQSNGQFDIFVIKFDSEGNYLWAKSFGGSNSDYGNVISVDSLGFIYTSGQYFSTVDFDPSSLTFNITSAGTWDIYINKFDSNGNFVWAKSMGGGAGDEAFGLFTDRSGNIYSSGKFRDTADLDPGINQQNYISKGDYDIYFGKYDTDGNLIWVNTMGDEFVDYAYTSVVDLNENVYYIGTFDGTVDFDFTTNESILSTSNQSDIFISKISQSSTNSIIENNIHNNLIIFPNPAKNYFYVQLNIEKTNVSKVLASNNLGEFFNLNINFKNTKYLEVESDILNKGFYFIQMYNTENQIISVKKLVIE